MLPRAMSGRLTDLILLVLHVSHRERERIFLGRDSIGHDLARTLLQLDADEAEEELDEGHAVTASRSRTFARTRFMSTRLPGQVL